jgi:hypothetical protein
MLKIVECAVLIVFALGTESFGELYRINAAAATKEIKPVDYRLGTPTNPTGTAITSNNYYLLKDGKPWLPVMGEIHYARYPDFMWEDAIKKMKAGGIDIVATYCFWIHHEEVKGEFDFTGRRDLRRFVQTCKSQGLYVWLRLGPWCHGEVRNGGFPDWLQRMNTQKRRNSPEYLGYVRQLFSQYFAQVRGLLYKDGGPIIGIQLENEFGGPPEHILELKRIAREVGFDVPIYTVTGWNNVHIPEKEVIPVQAGYPDDFWSSGLNRNPLNEQYLFMAGVPINTGVGTDVLPVVEVYGRRTYNPSDYPWLTAELGLGIQWTARRRPVIDERDAGALMLIKLAGGANSVGYYMYHGGSNPEGKLSTLQETGDNQCPVISYDFQGAVGEFGEIAPKYRVLKLVHYWLEDFGPELAPMIPSMPEKRPAGVDDVDTFRTMMRSDGNSGYLFFSNYQRYAPNKDLSGIQVEVKLKDATVTVPAQPVTIPKDSFGFWPVQMNLNGAVVEYATAQPFARFTGQDADTYFFAAYDSIAPEFAFKSDTINRVSVAGQEVQKQERLTFVRIATPAIERFIEVTPSAGKPLRICVLPRQAALHATRIETGGVKRLIVTEGADVLEGSDAVDLRSLGRTNGSLWVFPAVQSMRQGSRNLAGEQAGVFRRFSWSVPEKKVAVTVQNTGKLDAASYTMTIPADALEGQNVYDVYLDLDQVSNYLTVKSGAKLIGDWYYIGPHYRPSLRHWGEHAIGTKLDVELQPITPNTQVFIEDRFRPDFTSKMSYAEIRGVAATPMYRIQFGFTGQD